MGRTYKRKPGSRNYKNYSDVNLEEALTEVATGKLSIRAASNQYNISFGTLYNKFKGLHTKKPGGQTVLSELEEKCIIREIVKCGDWGFPISMLDLRMFIKHYLDTKGRTCTSLKNNLPGKDLVYSMLKRHKSEASQRLCANIKRTRACLSHATIRDYFKNLASTIADVSPSNIYNFDETNLSDDPGKSRFIFRRGVKYPERVVNFSKSATSIMMCGSADGTLLPPYIVYKSECMWDTWCQNGPKGAPCCTKQCCSQGSRYARTKHGWFDAQTFQDWFQLTFLPHAKRLPGRKVVIGDNLSSHINISVIKLCQENSISFVCLPPNATHLCQPLDVCFFRAMKGVWRKQLLEWKQKYPRCGILPKEKFPTLLRNALIDLNGPSGNKICENLISGFRATGIFPLHEDKVLSKLPEAQEESTLGQQVNDTLTQFLQSQRTALEPAIRRKRNRLNVEPGRSITAPHESSSDSDVDTPPDETSTSDDSAESSSEGNDETPETLSGKDGKEIEVGNFVLVNFCFSSKKSQVYRYVCKVLQINSSTREVKVMGLKSIENKCAFKPVKDDVSTVSVIHIIKVLPDPDLNAADDGDVYTFQQNVDIKEFC